MTKYRPQTCSQIRRSSKLRILSRSTFLSLTSGLTSAIWQGQTYPTLAQMRTKSQPGRTRAWWSTTSTRTASTSCSQSIFTSGSSWKFQTTASYSKTWETTNKCISNKKQLWSSKKTLCCSPNLRNSNSRSSSASSASSTWTEAKSRYLCLSTRRSSSWLPRLSWLTGEVLKCFVK